MDLVRTFLDDVQPTQLINLSSTSKPLPKIASKECCLFRGASGSQRKVKLELKDPFTSRTIFWAYQLQSQVHHSAKRALHRPNSMISDAIKRPGEKGGFVVLGRSVKT